MAANEQKLLSDHQDVVNTIRRYKNITLISTSGKPVNEYDIEYRLQGYTTDSNKNVVVSKRHRVKFSIPFGYPHFPPTIKPLSPIFHPQIDEYVVPISNYWEENRSLSDVILHIGNMICGQSYTLYSPLNLEAAQYFEKHSKNLPLDRLQLFEENTHPSRQWLQLDTFGRFFKLAAIAVPVILLGAGGTFFYEHFKLRQAGESFTRAEILEVDHEFQKARKVAGNALDQLGTFVLLRPAKHELEKKIHRFMQSRSLVEGLKGNVKFDGRYVPREQVEKLFSFEEIVAEAQRYSNNGSLQQAMESYEKALEFAVHEGLQITARDVEKQLAAVQLKLLVSASRQAHAGEDHQVAVGRHNDVLTFLQKNTTVLADTAQIQEKTKRLLLIDRIALHRQKAATAEEEKDYGTALKHHNAVIDRIETAHVLTDTTIANALANSRQKLAELTEKQRIDTKRHWLIDNYKDIFQTHYPSTISSTLHRPRATFIKYDGNTLVFNLNCLEKGTGSLVMLSIYYQYTQGTGRWSIYTNGI